MGNRTLTGALLLLMCAANAHATTVRPQDYTLDLVLPSSASNQNFNLSDLATSPGVDPWISFLSGLPGFSQIHWGIDLLGTNAFNQNPTEPMVPASVQKMITTASAFYHLGTSARFENYFEANYDASSGIASDVKFTVSGDPTWGHPEYESFSARIDQVIAALQAKGITEVHGEVNLVSTRPELDQVARPTGWPLRWTNQCMATMPSTFMINGNCGSLKVTSTTTAVWTTPGVDLPLHLNITAGTANNLTITAEQDSLLRVTGYTITGQFKSATTYFRDPLQGTDIYNTFPVYFGTRWLKNLFIQALAAKNISYVEMGASVVEAGQVNPPAILVDLSSLALKDVLKTAVQKSINAILDRTYFETSHILSLATPSDASIGTLRDIIQDENLMSGIQVFDGSGLVVDDRMRADTMLAFLTKIQNQTYFQDFLSVLAVSGQAGTLVNRLSGPLTKGNIFAKTGTIDNYYNLVGYFRTPSQALEPFAIFTSSSQTASSVQALIDQVVTEFAGLNTP